MMPRRRSCPICRLDVLRSLAAVGLALAGACTSVAVHKTTQSPSSQERVASVAVAPFQDLTGNSSASPAVTAAIVNELRRRGTFQVMELDDAAPGNTERWTASKLGKEAKADAVLVGVVTSYSYDRVSRRGGSSVTPAIGVDLRLVSTKNAEVLWAAAVDAKLTQLFSDDGMPLEQLAQKLAERVADALAGIGARS